MEVQTTNSNPTPNTADTPTDDQKYQAAVEAINAIRALLPELESPHPDTVKFVQTMKGFPRPFLDRSLLIVQQTPGYQALNRFDVEAVQKQIAVSEGNRSVQAALKLLLVEVAFTADVNFARAMNQALQTYQIGQGLARDTVLGAPYVPGVNEMKVTLGRTGVRKAAKLKTQEPPAAPAVPPLTAKTS
jgi:hypothetical protein